MRVMLRQVAPGGVLPRYCLPCRLSLGNETQRALRPMAECQFCGTDATLTAEHVWPDWALRYVRERAGGGTHRVWGPRGDEMVNFSGQEPDLTIRATCAECNHNRLGKLEGEAAPLLRPLIDGRERIILKQQQPLIALWATKTAMVIELVKPTDSPRFFGLPERKTLAINRTMPDGVVVVVGLFGDRVPTAFFHAPAWPIEKGMLYVATVSIGQLILQTLAFRDPSGTPTAIRTEDEIPPALKLVWPPRDRNILWPLDQAFDYNGLWTLSHYMAKETPPPKRPPPPKRRR